MWIEERQSKKGTRYKYCERFELPNGEIRKVSVIFNTNSNSRFNGGYIGRCIT